MSKIVIGIGGQKHSGKDTVASMLLYINHKGPAAAKYNEWAESWKKGSYLYSQIATHFADPLKDCCSIMFNIKREYFDDIKYKDDLYYDFRKNEFIKDIDITLEHNRLVPTDFLDFSNFANKIANNVDAPLIKIRNLMQVYADTMKYVFGEDVFVNTTIRRVNDICRNYNFALVPDVRFSNEAIALRQTNDVWQGYIIRVIRKSEQSNDLHNSEVCNFQSDYIIENDNTLFSLFYKVIDIYNKIIKENQWRDKVKRAVYEAKQKEK